MKTWYLQCFLHGGWLARSANLQICRISCNRPSENVLFAMFRLRHRGVVPIHPLLCQIIIYIYVILNLLIYSLVNRSDICLYLIPVKLSLRVTSFSVSKFSEFFQLKCSNLMLPDINFFHLTLPVVLLFVGDWMTPTPSHRAHPFRRGERGITVYLYPESILLLLRYLI